MFGSSVDKTHEVANWRRGVHGNRRPKTKKREGKGEEVKIVNGSGRWRWRDKGKEQGQL